MTGPTLNCDVLAERLSEYMEETLDLGTRHAIEAHAKMCAPCGALLSDIRALARDARTLPALAPSRDLWSGISHRIEAPVVGADMFSLRRARRLSLVPWLMAAAAGLVLTASGITYVATREAMEKRFATRGAQSSGITNAVEGGVTRNASASPGYQTTYETEIGNLRAIVRERRAELDSAVVAEIERNLAIIDRAIAESRAALSRDPNSGFLNDHLMTSLHKKVELLRTVAMLPART
ncbi:MAG: zf-HC2 domain-containing protein [Gemmatimonadaceae bacterium]